MLSDVATTGIYNLYKAVKANMGKCRFWPASLFLLYLQICSWGIEQLGSSFDFIFLFYLMKVMAGTNFRYHFLEGTSLWRLLTVITLHLIRVYSQGMAFLQFEKNAA